MASNKLLLIASIALSVLSLPSSSLSTSSLLRAADALSHSGFLSMSLTLQLLSTNLTSSSCTRPPPFLTIFSPSDSAFASSGQPSLSLLHFHFSPLRLPPSSLKSLRFNSKIPTLSSNRSLTVTSSSLPPRHRRCVSLNGVRINADSPVYDDGTSIIVFGINEFLDPGYGVSRPAANHKCQQEAASFIDTTGVFEEVGGILRSKGYSVMASFLELQVIGFKEKSTTWISSTGLTLFAPVDQAMMINAGNFSEYASLFFRHLVPCKILWNDLNGFNDGVELKTLLKGFKINVTRSGEVLMLNGVGFTSLDLYYSDWLVVHGLRQVLTVPERPKEVAAASSLVIGSDTGKIAPHDNGEF
ncbi:hypothetical protein ACOSP7_019613 [Xanthoceras sorbifolium]